MLRALSIRDYVIVERLDLELAAGFTALTGETGAGKSILVDAVALALGGRADPGVVRAGAQRAEVSADFDAEALTWVTGWSSRYIRIDRSCGIDHPSVLAPRSVGTAVSIQ